MAERGCDVMALARILGHANLRTVMRYVHIGQEALDLAMLKYGETEALKIPAETPERLQ